MSKITTASLPKVSLAEIDLSSPEFWLKDRLFREGAFKTLRDESPFAFFKELVIEDSLFPTGPGYRAITRHDDIWHISRNPQLFCSGKGSNIGDLPMEMNEFFGSMINMDDPKHFRLRSIVSRGFDPKEVARAVLWMSSEDSGMLTGAVIHFDQSVWGGYDGQAPAPSVKLKA